ncbi:MAG: aminomethyl transferase family protein, partial [bacterium]|nr:aminomethyl transferase family protein [bacterium]
DTDDIDVTLDEAILKDGECVGYVTSGGYAHHVRRSMAMGYVPAEMAADGTELEVEINGEMYAARVVAEPLYDPAGERMRG